MGSHYVISWKNKNEYIYQNKFLCSFIHENIFKFFRKNYKENIFKKGRNYMISKHKLYQITLVSAAIILMLVNIVGAKPYNYGSGATLITDNSTQSVDLLKFPACGGGVALTEDPVLVTSGNGGCGGYYGYGGYGYGGCEYGGCGTCGCGTSGSEIVYGVTLKLPGCCGFPTNECSCDHSDRTR